MDLLFLPFSVFVAFPPLAFALAALLAVGYARSRKRFATKADARWSASSAVAWLPYAFYELAMARWSRTVVAPIRFDLLIVAPLLYGLSFLGARALWRAGSRRTA